MPRNSAPTRKAILEAALAVLRSGGIAAFSVEAVARGAGVAKGLVIYHYRSRGALLAESARVLEQDRAARLAAALRTRGTAGIDACWAELVRQHSDGTGRAWLSLSAAGLVVRPPVEFEAWARHAVLDGCAAALAAGASQNTLRPAYEALWLALLPVLEDDGG